MLEVQLLLQAFLEAKKVQHKSYEARQGRRAAGARGVLGAQVPSIECRVLGRAQKRCSHGGSAVDKEGSVSR